MTPKLSNLLILLLAVSLLTAPAVAQDVEVNAVISALVVHTDSSLSGIGYTANGVAGADWIPVLSRDVVVFSPKMLPDGAVFKAVVHRSTGDVPLTGDPVTGEIRVSGFSATTPESIDVYLSLIDGETGKPLPPQLPDTGRPESGTHGSTILSPPPEIVGDITGVPEGIYTASVENGGAAQFAGDQVIYQVIMPEGYTGDVILTTYTRIRSDEPDIYHLCDISITGVMPEGTTALVKFWLPLSVITENGYSPADVCLYHHGDDGKWTRCPTVYQIVGDTVYYEATVSDFSPFAVVFEKGAATPKGESMPPTTETPKSPLPLAGVLAGLGVSILLYRKR